MKPAATLLILLAATVALSACGRYADLDTPYQAKVDARKEAKKNGEPVPPEPTPPPEDRHFILDGLIQ